MCGGSNPVQDLVSSVSDTLASIDPGPSIGSGLASLDSAVSQNVPGGWGTIGALAAAVLTAGASIPASEAEFIAADAANLSAQGLSQEAIAQNLTASYGISASDAATVAGATNAGAADTFAQSGTLNPSFTAQQTADPFAGLSANAPVDTTLSQAAAAANTAAPAVTQALPYTEAYDAANLVKQGIGADQVANILTTSNPALDPFIAQDIATMAANGLSESAINQALQYSYSANELQPLGLESLASNLPSSSLNLSDLNNARRIYNLSKGLTGSSGSAGYSLSPYTTLSGLSGSSGLSQNVTNIASPRATMVKGQQIASQMPTGLENPVQTATVSQPAFNPLADLQLIQNAATGGYMQHMSLGGLPLPMSDVRMKGRQTGFGIAPHGASLTANILGHRAGGEIEGHNPTFFSVGGLNSLENTYVQGEGDGTSDDVAAMLADGEFVIPADVVSKIGNGSSNAGAKVLDQFLETVREHAQNHDPKDLPPSSKGPLAYLQEAKRKVNA